MADCTSNVARLFHIKKKRDALYGREVTLQKWEFRILPFFPAVWPERPTTKRLFPQTAPDTRLESVDSKPTKRPRPETGIVSWGKEMARERVTSRLKPDHTTAHR